MDESRQPIFLDMDKSDTSSSKRILLLRGWNDKMKLFEIDSQGKAKENKDELLIQHFREETEHMTKDVSKERKWRNHMCIEEGSKTVYQLNKDFSQFKNTHFANSYL